MRTVSVAFLSCVLGAIALNLEAATFPDPTVDETQPASKRETAVLAGGCFWGVEDVFDHVKGVSRVVTGYSGGDKSTAHSNLVEAGNTGHAESVQITYDPSKITYGQILKIFFSVVHNPTELNRQGPDVGMQYRSAIFYADGRQKSIANAYIQELSSAHVLPGEIVTQVVPLSGFYPAENFLQHFSERHPADPYVTQIDLPKLANLKALFPALYK